MRIIVADDQARVRSALRLLLEQTLAHQIIGEAGCLIDLLTLAESQPPDLILLDWELPRQSAKGRMTNGVSDRFGTCSGVLQELKHRLPLLKIIVMSGRWEARQAALLAGADLFISKHDSPAQLLAAIYHVNRGISPDQSDGAARP